MLQFPSESKNDKNLTNFFVMTPIRFRISTNRITAKQDSHKIPKAEAAIILPTPASGINLSEGGNWDEESSFQHSLTQEGAFQAGAGSLAKKGLEVTGGFGKNLKKGEFINDYASLSYQGSNMREFTFGWDLIPNSKNEAVTIINIIKQIRFFSLPNYERTRKGFIQYPYMWDVNPAINSKIELNLKDCVITNLNVNYTPEGVLKTYNSGHPISVNMEITFKELYKATDGDVGYSGDHNK